MIVVSISPLNLLWVVIDMTCLDSLTFMFHTVGPQRRKTTAKQNWWFSWQWQVWQLSLTCFVSYPWICCHWLVGVVIFYVKQLLVSLCFRHLSFPNLKGHGSPQQWGWQFNTQADANANHWQAKGPQRDEDFFPWQWHEFYACFVFAVPKFKSNR